MVDGVPSGDRFASLLAAVPDPVYTLDTAGRITSINRAEGTTGYSREELIGEHASKIMTEASVERGREVVRALLADDGRDHATFEMDLLSRDGEHLPHENHVALLPPDEDGEVPGTIGVLRDISGQRTRERELERYERIVTAMGDGVYALDARGRYTQVNEHLLGLMGYDRDTVIGAEPSLFHDRDEIEQFEAAIASLLDGDEDVATVEASLETADGTSVPIEVNLTLLPDDEGRFRGTVGVVRDVSERRTRERELEMYERVVTASGDGMYALDTDGRYTFMNRAAADLRGYAKEELLGEHVSTVMDEENIERAEALIRDLLKSDDRRHGTIEIPLVTKDGERIHVENQIAPLTDEDGRFRGTVGVVRDITERTERERELQRQNDRLDQFASVLSHDLRNPLNLAQGRLELARAERDGEHLAEIDWALERMDQLVDDVLTLARQGQTPEDTEPVPLAAAAEEAWATAVGDAEGLAIASGTGVVVADESRLKRLLGNLFRNSVEHGSTSPDSHARQDAVEHGSTSPPSQTREGGQEHAVSDPRVVVGPTDDGFYVADDGPGIPEDHRDRLFEEGFTTADDGTGFGLAIVREIVEAHGWTVTVAESESGGARFEVAGVEFAGE